MAGGWQHVLLPWASSVHNGAVTVSLFVHVLAVTHQYTLITSKRSDLKYTRLSATRESLYSPKHDSMRLG